MANKIVHLRKVRAKYRTTLSQETAQQTRQVRTLCNKWRSPGHTLREDAGYGDNANTLTCDGCKEARDMTRAFGD